MYALLWRIFVNLLWCLVLFCVFLASIAVAAPAPRPKPKKPPPALAPHIGVWKMRWGTTTGVGVFYKDGGYEAQGWGGRWCGSWKLLRGKLIVTEGLVKDQDGVPYSMTDWSVDLNPDGRSGPQYDFLLEP